MILDPVMWWHMLVRGQAVTTFSQEGWYACVLVVRYAMTIECCCCATKALHTVAIHAHCPYLLDMVAHSPAR